LIAGKYLKVLVPATLIVIVVVAGFGYGLLVPAAVKVNGAAYADADITWFNWSGGSCSPVIWDTEEFFPSNIYNQTAQTALINYFHPLVQNLTEFATTCAGLVAAGGGSFSYPAPLPRPIPSGFKLLGYVLDVNVNFNNNVPISIENVSAISNGNGLPTNFVKSNCGVHCSYDVNVTLSPVTEPTYVTMTISATAPLMWFTWGNLGMIQKMIVVSFEFVPSSMSVQFG
jgi:hypothetical protein